MLRMRLALYHTCALPTVKFAPATTTVMLGSFTPVDWSIIAIQSEHMCINLFPSLCLAAAAQGHTTTVDTAHVSTTEVTDYVMILLAGIGFEAEVCDAADREAKDKLGPFAYIKAGGSAGGLSGFIRTRYSCVHAAHSQSLRPGVQDCCLCWPWGSGIACSEQMSPAVACFSCST